MPNPPSDPYGWAAQDAQIALNRAQQTAADEAAARAGYANQLANQFGQGQQMPTTSPGVPRAIKAVVLYVMICLAIIFVLMIVGFFGAFSGAT